MIGTFGIKELDDCSELLGTDDAPFNKYPDVTGLRRICNTGTTAWPPNTLIDSGGMLYWVPNWLENPVLSGEKVVVGIAEPRESAPISELRDEPGKLKAARQPPPASSVPSPPPPSRTGVRSRLRRFWHWLVSLCFCSCTTSPAAVYPTDWPAGEPPPSPPPAPPSPPPAPPGGSESEAKQRKEAGKRPNVAAGGGGSNKRAADNGAAGPSGSTASRHLATARRLLDRNPSDDDDPTKEAAAPAAAASKAKKMPAAAAPAAAASKAKGPAAAAPAAAASKAKGPAAATLAAEEVGATGSEAESEREEAVEGEAEASEREEEEPAATEPAAAADEGITPEKGQKALLAAVRLYDPKSKVENLPFTPLIKATRATDFEQTLTASSSRKDTEAACESLASKLGSLKKLGDLQKQAAMLMSMLEFPSPALLDAFAKALRAGEGGAAGGAAGGSNGEAVVARVLASNLFNGIEHVPSSTQILELKEICRYIRGDDLEVSCREPTSNQPSLRPARPDRVPPLHRCSCGGRSAATVSSWRTRRSTT